MLLRAPGPVRAEGETVSGLTWRELDPTSVLGEPMARLALPGPGRPQALYVRGPARVCDGGLEVPAGSTADLGTWFNAVPAAWWQRLIGPHDLHLTVRGAGIAVRLHSIGTDAVEVRSLLPAGGEATLLLRDPAADWYWLEVSAADGPGRLEAVEWRAVAPGLGATAVPPVTVVVPTYRREDDALAQIDALIAPELDGTVGHVVVVDQGRTLADHPGLAARAAAAGDRLVALAQDNLGGSGGYGRGMATSLRWPEDPVLLSDDDAAIDPEVLRRLRTWSAAAGNRVVLGTALLSAEDPTRLQALAERVDRRIFQWLPADGVGAAASAGSAGEGGPGLELAAGGPQAWSFTRPTDTADYAGWWGTLLPAGCVAALGGPAPYFLKWDDAEYGLRAKAAGYRVATLPTTGVWHPTWAAKGTMATWSAWPLHRNRLATAAAYGAGPGVVLDSLIHQVKHLLSLQYATADLWDAGIAEYLEGPGWMGTQSLGVRDRAQHLLDTLPRPQVPTAAGQVPLPARVIPTPTGQVPAPTGEAPSSPEPLERSGGGPTARLLWALTGLVRPAARGSGRSLVVSAPAFHWSAGLGCDTVVLADPRDPGGRSDVLTRDPRWARAAIGRTLRLHGRVLRHRRRLARAYRAALRDSCDTIGWTNRIESGESGLGTPT